MPTERIELNYAVVDALCGVRCTLEEIAAQCNCSPDTVQRRIKEDKGMTFLEYWKIKSSSGSIALRRKQYQLAMSGNVSMLIWLGKQHLGQKEQSKVETELTGAGGGPLDVNVNDVRERVTSRITSISTRIGAGISTPSSN